MNSNAPTLTGQDVGEADGALTDVLELALAPTGRNRLEYLALRVVDARGPYPGDDELIGYLDSQRQLARAHDAIRATIGRLRADGLLTENPVRLTEAGQLTLQRLASVVIPRTRELFDGFDPADLAAAHRVLVELTERARAMTGRR